ncbi:MAG: hypothetical protein ACR2HQ_03405 [Ilumatobacteraceae bacterium]
MQGGGVTGVIGQPWRADVTASGSIEPWDGSRPLDWHVAADDRWHTPAAEIAVRQHRVHGTPVFETRLRIPGGDALQRVWSIPDGGGMTCIEVTNESPLPIACAFTRADLLTARPPTTVPIQGIDLPAATTTVLPIGHRASVTVALGHSAPRPGRLPDRRADAAAVARGWVAMAERASRLDLPDTALVERVVAARCDLLLGGLADPDRDGVAFVVGAGELVRMGELDEPAVADLVPAVALVAESLAERPGWEVDAALDAAAAVLHLAGEQRAVADVARIVADRPTNPGPDTVESGPLVVASLERRLLRGTVLFPDGIPGAWRGASLEARNLRAGPATAVSFAVRWHGEHPAILWEVEGDSVELTAPAVDPAWRTTDPAGEALWRGAGT